MRDKSLYKSRTKNKKMRSIALFIAVNFLAVGPLCASEAPRVLHFDKKTYQAHYQNWSATQSDEGLLYFGNTDGLLEYDGSAWALHTLPSNQTVRAVAKGKDGLLFTGGYEEFGFWKRDAWGKLHYTSLSKGLSGQSIEQQEIWHILSSERGTFFQSFGVLFHYAEKQLRKVRIPNTIMFLQEINGQILAPVLEKGIYALEDDLSWKMIPGGSFFFDKTVTAMLPDPGGMLVCTQESGVYRYDGQRFRPWENPLNSELAQNRINKAIRLRDGRIAVGTILNGVYILGNQPKALHFNRVNKLQNNTVLALFEDRDGNVWLGLDKGIDLLALSDPFEYYEDSRGQIGTVYAAAVYEGYLYIGGNQGLFCKPFPGDEDFRLIPGTQGQVWQLKVMGGQLLCGHNQGTFAIQGQQATRISQVTGGWKLVEWPGQPDLLLQGTYTGIAVFSKDQAGKWIFRKKLEGIRSPIRNLVPDKKGFLWAVDPYEGVLRLRLSQDGLSLLSTDSINTRAGLPTDYNLDLLSLGDETLIWSKDQYFRWDAKTRRCSPYRGSRLAQNRGAKLIRMPDGELFQAYPQRTAWYDKKGFKAWLPIALVKNNEHIEKLPNGKYLFCIDNGYAILKTDASSLSSPRTPPIIRAVQPMRNGQPLHAGTIRASDGLLTLPSRSTSFFIHFAAPIYTQAPGFRYRIPGWQDNWSPWSPQPYKEIANLPPGKHQIQVACNLSPALSSISVFVKPRWYQTWWSIALLLVFGATLFYLMYRLHRYRLGIQRRRLIVEKERQLNDQRLQAKAEQLQTDVLNKSQELANSTFNLIRKNETLLQIKEELARVKADMGERLPDRYHSRLLRLIDSHLGSEQDWLIFETNFNQVHEVFLHKLKASYPDLTPGDLRLAAYLKMNLSSKEIAPLLNISLRGVENKRYRLRQKLHLDNDANLTEFLMQY
jgi:DNA-binding CsgD family transcriptional regulator